MGEDFVGARRGVHHVVGADDECHVGGLEFLVDVVELEDEIIGHAGFGKQDVHLARHAAGDRMDRELDGDACRLQQLVRTHRASAEPARQPDHSRGRR